MLAHKSRASDKKDYTDQQVIERRMARAIAERRRG
jgi:hypothetical protein